jgi:hypothetical protein
LLFSGPIPEADALPTVDEVLQELHFSDSDGEDIRQEKIVDWPPSEGSDRELALGMAFLVNTKPDEPKELDPGVIILKQVSVITAHGGRVKHHVGFGRSKVAAIRRKRSRALFERGTGPQTEP